MAGLDKCSVQVCCTSVLPIVYSWLEFQGWSTSGAALYSLECSCLDLTAVGDKGYVCWGTMQDFRQQDLVSWLGSIQASLVLMGWVHCSTQLSQTTLALSVCGGGDNLQYLGFTLLHKPIGCPRRGQPPSLTSPMSNSQQPCQFLGNTCAVPGNLCSIMEATRMSWSLFSSPLFMLCRPIVSLWWGGSIMYSWTVCYYFFRGESLTLEAQYSCFRKVANFQELALHLTVPVQ